MNELKTPAAVISILNILLLIAAVAVAVISKSESAIAGVLGAIIVNATTTVNFYLGSSKSSQTKDETIAGQLPPAPTSPLPLVVPVPPPPPGSSSTTKTETTQTTEQKGSTP